MDLTNVTKLDGAIAAVEKELNIANRNHPLFNSRHEGYAVLLEEVDELFDCVKGNIPNALTQAECVQVAAMAIKMLISPIWE